jgi:hypothetical protein
VDYKSLKIADAMWLADIGYKYYEHWYVEYLEKTLIKRGTGWQCDKDTKKREAFERKGIIYKVWPKVFLERDNVPAGMKQDFYRKICKPLIGLIYDEEAVCRGYVMKKCNLNVSHKHINSTIKILQQETRRTGLYYKDCVPQNFCLYKNEPQVIDLENVITVRGNKIKTKNIKYNKTVKEVYDELLHRVPE